MDELPLYSEIAPLLWIGATDEEDLVGMKRSHPRIEDKSLFELVITLNPIANPFGWYVREYRYGFPDGKLRDEDLGVIEELANFGFKTWTKRKNVMVRCQMGINRSALIVAMILMKSGKEAHEAVEMVRAKRSPYCLSNRSFLEFLSEYESK